ncbi:hypothetical protein CDAR_267421 [Caerostris darwini]|uniref:Uncharacterized protein n=1 Tax=Caerostris darwini TaxID=1538125 RepID=A0AAV4TH02_9ARAC|nr:hypothetical protein CDAR_267421 [Caerostris darwini]
METFPERQYVNSNALGSEERNCLVLVQNLERVKADLVQTDFLQYQDSSFPSRKSIHPTVEIPIKKKEWLTPSCIEPNQLNLPIRRTAISYLTFSDWTGETDDGPDKNMLRRRSPEITDLNPSFQGYPIL